MLLFERGYHRHHDLHKARALGTLRPKAPFAPQDTRADGVLRRIVRGLDAFHTHKGPQGVVDFEDKPRQNRLCWLSPRWIVDHRAFLLKYATEMIPVVKNR